MRPTSAGFVVLAVVAVGACAYFAFLPGHAGTVSLWTLAAAANVVLAALAVAWARREDLLRDWLTPTWGDFTRGVIGAAVFYGLAWAFVRLGAPPGSPREIWLVSLYGQLGDPRALQANAPLVAATIAVTSLAEEIVWRGAVTQMLAEQVGSRLAWIWAALLYALAYVPTAWSLRAGDGSSGSLDPVLVLAGLAGGLFWGAMARRYGRLVPSILAHALFDWTVVMMFPLWGRFHP